MCSPGHGRKHRVGTSTYNQHAVWPCGPNLAPTLLRHHPIYDTGHVCENVLLSGFEAGLGIRHRADAVEQAVASSTLLADKSHWGILRVQGEDRMRFLHSQGTNAFEGVVKGESASSPVTTAVLLWYLGRRSWVTCCVSVGRERRPRYIFRKKSFADPHPTPRQTNCFWDKTPARVHMLNILSAVSLMGWSIYVP